MDYTGMIGLPTYHTTGLASIGDLSLEVKKVAEPLLKPGQGSVYATLDDTIAIWYSLGDDDRTKLDKASTKLCELSTEPPLLTVELDETHARLLPHLRESILPILLEHFRVKGWIIL